MYQWLTIMAGGPQDGLQFTRRYSTSRPTPPSMRAADGRVCCPVATHTAPDGGCSVVVHTAATPHPS